MKLKSLAILTAVVSLAGCTLPKSPISNPTPGSSGIAGNWELTLTDTTGGTAPIGIYFTQSGSTVSGIAWVQMAFPLCIASNGIPCAFPFGVINPDITGAIDTKGNIVLNSTTGGSSPATFSVNANTTTNTTLSGTYSITLTTPTATANDSGTVTGTMIAPLNGTYAGTVVSSQTGNSMGVITTLNQSSSLNSRSLLSVTASATFTGSPCFTTATMQGPADTYCGFLGNSFSVSLVSTSNSSMYIEESGTVSPDAKTIQFSYGVVNLSGNGCVKNDYGSGTLTLQ